MRAPVNRSNVKRGRDGGPAETVKLGLLPGLLGYQLRRAQLLTFQSFSEAMAAWRISPGEFGVLVIVSDNPGLNQSRLANALGVDRSTMVAVLDGLEGRGLLQRTPSPTDRRSHAMLLTKAGTKLLADIRPALEAHERRLTAALSTDERKVLLALLARVNTLEGTPSVVADENDPRPSMPIATCGDVLRRSTQRFPERIALILGKRQMTYRELDAAANRFANGLMARGLKKGDKAAILCANLPEFPIAYFGCAKAGVVLTTFSLRATPDDIEYMLDKAEVRLLVVQEAFAEPAAESLTRFDLLEHVLVIGDQTGNTTKFPGTEDFDAFVADGSPDEPGVEISETDPLAITFTGGTTGKPKAVVVSHRARFMNNITGAIQFGVSEQDKVTVVTPLFHAVGLFVWYQLAVYMGLTCVLLPRWDPEELIETIAAEDITAIFLVPTQVSDLVKHPAFSAEKLKTLRSIDYAGAPMPLAVLEEAMRLLPNVSFTEHFGQSETGPIVIRQAWDPPEKHGSIGRPAIGIDMRVVNPEGEPVAPGEIGEIVTRGPHLLTEYYRDPEQTAALYKSGDEWLWTGDLATVDADGFVTIADRSKDMLISGGENIYPKELEDAIYQHPAVAECAVFGIPDERFGEVPAAHVVLKPGRDASEEELIDFCGARVARFKRPRLVRFVDSLPKTPVGKIQKHVIRAPYWQGREKKV